MNNNISLETQNITIAPYWVTEHDRSSLYIGSFLVASHGRIKRNSQ